MEVRTPEEGPDEAACETAHKATDAPDGPVGGAAGTAGPYVGRRPSRENDGL